MSPSEYSFGRHFTDHMLTIDYDKSTGWGKPQILPYGTMKIPVSATSLHYGISCYEGVNILKNKTTGKSQAFRPE